MYSACLYFPADVKEHDLERLAQAFEGISQAHSVIKPYNDTSEPWRVEWILDHEKDDAFLSQHLRESALIHDIAHIIDDELNWEIEKIDESIDWLSYSYQQFPPFSVGPFFIYGSHYDDDIPKDKMGLQIDAATAFGSGEHGTTKGCLRAMLRLKDDGVCPWNILDMGTGSGILAIAAWKLWKTPVLAVDVDAESVDVAERHREMNKVKGGKTDMFCVCGDGFNTAEVQHQKPYELVIANILAGPLKDMAQPLYQTLDENGFVILSGILNEQAEDVLNVYLPLGLTLIQHIKIEEWSTLILRKT